MPRLLSEIFLRKSGFYIVSCLYGLQKTYIAMVWQVIILYAIKGLRLYCSSSMKIKSTDSASPTSSVRRAARSKGASGSSFSAHLQGPEEAQGISGVSPLGNIDSLLSLQAMGSATDHRSKARQHGEDVLNSLEGILHDMLVGSLPISRLQNLADMMQKQRELGNLSPKMAEIIDEIETRALIELAKYESYI